VAGLSAPKNSVTSITADALSRPYAATGKAPMMAG
jgi:hypothetical protein